MFKLFESGNFKDKGYIARMFLLFPIFVSTEVDNIIGGKTKIKEISLPSTFSLTEDKYYVRIELTILGFGIVFEIHERSY